MSKLETLCEVWGMTEMEMLEQATFDAVASSICMNEDCDYCCEMEPDQGNGWCEACDTQSVASCLILAGII